MISPLSNAPGMNAPTQTVKMVLALTAINSIRILTAIGIDALADAVTAR